jgi:hypothetical protein
MKIASQVTLEGVKPEKVWKYYTDLRNQKSWQRGLQSTKKVSKTVSTKGSQFGHIYGLDTDKYIIVSEEVLENKKLKKFVTRQVSDHFETVRSTTFKITKDEVEINLEVETKFRKWWLKLIAPSLKEEYKRRLDKDFINLQRILEEG